MDTDDFLRAFFGEGNRFDYDSLVSPSTDTHRAVKRWAKVLDGDGSTVLPRWEQDGVTWYGLAENEKKMKRLIEQVKSFIGPNFSTFTGDRARLDREDPVERAIQEYTRGKALRFRGKDRAIRTRVSKMHQVRALREPHATEKDLGTGVVLRRFNMALVADDRTEAEKQIQYLQKRGLLDPANIRYLQIRMRAAFEAWEEIVQFEDLSKLVEDASHPLPVRRALLQGVYHTHFDSYEKQGDPEGALEHYKEMVQPEYGPLFAVRSSMQAPEVLKAFMMKAVSGEATDEDLRAELKNVADQTGLDDPFLEALAELGVGTEGLSIVENPISEAMKAWSKGDADTAFRLLQQAEPSSKKGECLVLVHGNLQSPNVEQELEDTLTDLPSEERKELAQEHSICRHVIESAGLPSGWRHWLSRVREGDYEESGQEASRHADKISENWHPQRVLSTEGALEELVQQVRNAPIEGNSGLMISQALPHLLKSLQKDPEYPRSTFQDLYGSVLERIPYSSDLTQSDFDVYRDLAEVRLSYGVTEDTYWEILEGAETLWKEAGSRRRIDWLLDFAELLILAPSRDEEAQLRFLTTASQALQKHRERIEPIQVEFFQSLCEEIGHPEVGAQLPTDQSEKETEESNPLRRLLDGQTLGIYTLTESAGRRVASFLEDHCRDVTIHLRHDKAGNDDLERTAKNADYFLVVTRSAAHAATDIIEKNVPTERLIRPQGKGESSMLRDLTSYAKRN